MGPIKTQIILKAWIEESGQVKSAFKQESMEKHEMAMLILEFENMINILKQKFLNDGGYELLKDDE